MAKLIMIPFGKKTVFILAAISKTETKTKMKRIMSKAVPDAMNLTAILISPIRIPEKEGEKKEVESRERRDLEREEEDPKGNFPPLIRSQAWRRAQRRR